MSTPARKPKAAKPAKPSSPSPRKPASPRPKRATKREELPVSEVPPEPIRVEPVRGFESLGMSDVGFGVPVERTPTTANEINAAKEWLKIPASSIQVGDVIHVDRAVIHRRKRRSKTRREQQYWIESEQVWVKVESEVLAVERREGGLIWVQTCLEEVTLAACHHVLASRPSGWAFRPVEGDRVEQNAKLGPTVSRSRLDDSNFPRKAGPFIRPTPERNRWLRIGREMLSQLDFLATVIELEDQYLKAHPPGECIWDAPPPSMEEELSVGVFEEWLLSKVGPPAWKHWRWLAGIRLEYRKNQVKKAAWKASRASVTGAAKAVKKVQGLSAKLKYGSFRPGPKK